MLEETAVEPPRAPPPPTFRAVFEAELSYVWNTLRRLGVPSRDLQDVAHEVFLVVHLRLASYDPTRPIRPWLFAIAFRCSSDYRRRAGFRRELFVEPNEEPSHEAPPADALLIDREEREVILRALDRVPEDRRAVVLLHDFDETPMPQITDALGIPLRTGYSRLRVGREELTAALKRLLSAQERRGVR